MRDLRPLFIAPLLLASILIGIQGCASLEPLPRFRTSSMTFAPDQLPVATRSTADLLDPTQVGAYSLLKEHAQLNAEPSENDMSQRTVVNRHIAPVQEADIIGLDREELDDDLDASLEFAAEEPSAEEAIVQKIVRHNEPVLDANEANPAVNRIEMMKEIVNLLGNPYRYGGMNAVSGLDCSAFVGTVYSRAFGMRLPRSSNEQFGTGSKIKKDDLKIGDLVFFKTRRRRGPVSHVGIYIGENLFAHASTRHGVIISPIDQGYYQRTYVGARRLVNPNLTEVRR